MVRGSLKCNPCAVIFHVLTNLIKFHVLMLSVKKVIQSQKGIKHVLHILTDVKISQSVTNATCWTNGVRFSVTVRIFFFATASRPAFGPTQPPIQRVPEVLSPGVKRPESEADHSPPSSGEFKNA